MKLSQYNFIYTNVLKNSNVSVIYNARTGALAVLTPQNYSQLKNLEEHNLPITDKNFEKQLLQCGYLLPKDFDELQQIKYDMLQNRFNPVYMDLTIAPTLACNFRCIYCFEKGQRRSQTMSEQTIQKIISFVRAQANHLEELSITWYGGEPLLALPQLESISKQLWDLCDEFHINYSSSIITNGYLLDVNTANILKNNHVDEIQITIDGPKPIHDKRRPLANDGGTFDTIMEHLLQIKGILPVNIRINTDYENREQINDVMDFFRKNGLMEDITVYLGLVTPSNGQYEGSKCMTDKAYSKFNLRFMQDNDIPLMYLYPAPKNNYCTADHVNSWVIDPHGDMYKCWIDIGIPKRRAASLKTEEQPVNLPLRNHYMLYDPTEDTRCKNCKHLPLCMGGCPHNRMENLNICVQYKYNLDEYLMECTKILLKN